MQYLLTTIWDDRALAAYWRQARREGVQADQPAAPSTYVDSATGHYYVVLANQRGVLATYRVGYDDRLRRVKQCPHSLPRM